MTISEAARRLGDARKNDSARAKIRITGLSVADMDRPLLDMERGFLHRFAQGRMRVDGAAEILRAAAEFHYGDSLRDQFGGGMRENVGAQDAISLCIRDKFHHAFIILVRHGTAVGAEREFA